MSSSVVWRYLILGLAMIAIGAYFVRITRLGKPLTARDPFGFVFALRLYVKGGAWMFIVGGSILVLMSLSSLLGR